MKILKHYCSDCDSKFKIEFDELKCDDNPQYCPFCSTYIMEDELEQDDDY
jgi:predicted  nucleic acid-binding Zn-ribbon protein